MTEHTIATSISFRPADLRWLQQEAERHDLSVSGVIRALVRRERALSGETVESILSADTNQPHGENDAA